MDNFKIEVVAVPRVIEGIVGVKCEMRVSNEDSVITIPLNGDSKDIIYHLSQIMDLKYFCSISK